MIYANTRISIIDNNLPMVTSRSIESLMNQYYIKSVHVDGVTMVILDGGYKIRDLKGWTDIKKIICYPTPVDTKWFQIAGGQHQLIVSGDHKIPVFNTSKTREGFHGQILYSYEMIPAESLITIGNEFVMKESKTGDDEKDIFSHCTIRDIRMDDRYVRYGYEIETVSGFYNANNIYMHQQKNYPPATRCWN